MKTRNGLSIVIPVYNEEKIIERNTERLIRFLKTNLRSSKFEIILVSNGSTDSTVEKGTNLQKKFRNRVKIISINKKGVGNAFRKGVNSASHEYIVSLDMDLSVDPKFVLRCLKELENYSMVVGSKSVGRQDRPFYRKVISDTYIFMAKMLLGLDFSDYSIGAKGYRKSDIKNSMTNLDSHTFYVVELIYRLKRKGKRIVEVPTYCKDKRKSKFSLFHEIAYRFNTLLSFWFLERVARPIKRRLP